MSYTKQQDLWNLKWKNLKNNLPSTNYAKRVYNFIKNENVKTILDLGAGDGKDSLFFSKKGYNITSLDFSKEAIKKINNIVNEKNIGNIKTIIMDIKELHFNKKFDVIYANLSLHYFDDKHTTKIFSNLFEILNPKG